MSVETISAVGTVVAAGLAALTAWRAERITAGATRERQREQWRRIRGAARLVTLELTSASLPLRRLLRDYERALVTYQSVGDAGVRLMRVSRVAWTEHQPLLADRLKPDPLSDVEHAYRTLEDVVDHIAATPVHVGIALTNKAGGERSKAERAIADVDVAQAHLNTVDAGFDTLLEVEQMREQSRWSRRLRARAREWRR